MGGLDFRSMDPEVVLWVDTAGSSGWDTKENYDTAIPAICRSVGFVSKEDKVSLTLIQNETRDAFDNSTTIPKSAIVARQVIAAGDKLIRWANQKVN